MPKKLNIIYYFEPWIELSRPDLRYHNIRYQMGPQIKALLKEGHKITFIIGDATYSKCIKENFNFYNQEVIIVKQIELKKIFNNYQSATTQLARGAISEADSSALISLYKNLLKDYKNTPDVIISFLSPIDFFKKIFPDTLVLYTEFGIFSRVPFPRSFYFDPFGMFNNSFIRKHFTDISKKTINNKEKEELENFRRKALYEGIVSNNPFKSLDLNEKGIFKKIFLLPLQFSNYFGFDSYCDYKSQFDFLIDILENTPEDVGILVTEHNGWEPVITKHNVEYLTSTYKNLIYKPEIYSYTNSSQYLLPLVDGVISVSSSVGLQALLWGKIIISPWDSHLRPFSIVNSLKDIRYDLEYDSQKNDNLLYYLLTHYYFSEKYAYDGKFFTNWLIESINKKNKLNSDFYRKIDKNGLIPLINELRINDMKNLIISDERKNNLTNNTIEENSFLKKCYKQIEEVDTISFDIFDTLLIRPFNMPHEMFLFMQNKVRTIIGDQTIEFHKIRRLAEHLARKNSNQEEISILDIYNKINELLGFRLKNKIIENIIEYEIECEFAFCEPRNIMKELYDYASKLGKNIIIISDFYISSRYVSKLLEKNGFNSHKKLYVSTDIKKTKKSSNLFKYVIKDLKIDPKTILHFGDNRESDLVNAQKNNIKSILIKKTSTILKENKHYSHIWNKDFKRTVFQSSYHEISQSIYFGLISNHLYENPEKAKSNSMFNNSSITLGYVSFGLLLFDFCKNILLDSKNKKIKTLYFLSRDAWIIKQAYDLIAKYDNDAPQSKYLYTSRKSLLLASIKDTESFIKTLETPFKPTSIISLLQKRYKIEDTSFLTNELLISVGLNSPEQIVHPVHQLVYLKELFRKIYPKIEHQLKNYRKGAIKYFEEEELYTENNLKAVVDIGYTGSIQKYMIELNIKNLNGYYFITNSSSKVLENLYNISINGYLDSNIDHQNTSNNFFNKITLIETLFSHSSPSLSNYNLDKYNKFNLEFENKNISTRRKQIIDNFQYGSLSFIKDIMSIYKNNYSECYFSKDFATRTIINYFNEPLFNDALLFEGIEFEDTFSAKDNFYVISNIVSQSKKLRNRKLVKELYENSSWKEGASKILSFYTKKIQNIDKNEKLITKKQNSKKLITKEQNSKKLFNKLKRNPYLYFYDSKKFYLRPLRHLFRKK